MISKQRGEISFLNKQKDTNDFVKQSADDWSRTHRMFVMQELTGGEQEAELSPLKKKTFKIMLQKKKIMLQNQNVMDWV